MAIDNENELEVLLKSLSDGDNTSDSEDTSELLSMLDELFNDTEMEVEAEHKLDNSINNLQEPDISNLDLDDDLKDLLGMNEDSAVEQGVAEKLSDEDLSRVANMEAEVDTLSNDNNGDAVQEQKKAGFISKLLSIFKKKSKNEDVKSNDENQQVLNELFDENGELMGDNKKAKKKGLFSKGEPNKQEAAETPVEFDITELVGSEEEKEPKKEKKKKEKKEKVKKEKIKKEKPKKVKKPKPQKVKQPVDPSELITVKPKAVLAILILAALISCVAFFFIKIFTYSQSFDSAMYYLMENKYTFAYESIMGVAPKSDEDAALIEQIETIMFVQKQYNSYERYLKMNMQVEAIDSLINGISKYDKYINKAIEIGVGDHVESVKALIVNTLWTEYGMTEDMARSYSLLTDSEQYNFILESYGGRVDDSDN